ncbi:putative CDP-alcohol phosphatidyltransferase class-I family protein 3 [Artemisia annua]|uniref:Putative CDP-alcohol phosphatidyltransferase class-I family protein 3 n=1 Tax=Artemisia annua TaxID=35608 RepID=A0A2U1NNL5_ARTAN|nr:putative CDP-alcohol phosphatidyltransferase class-I family protein 3 [Artemisia annua]
MGYIGGHGIKALNNYKYSGVDHSYVAKYVLQPFWAKFVTFFPLWMPPNMITLMGFMFLSLSAVLGYIYSPHLDTAPPRWVNFAHGLLLFLYQTFDAVDGKQARRTNSSSPLGELFDHGCDALACALEALAFASTAMCGRNAFWFWVISAVPFYFATWEHYFTNTLILPAVNGPTEGLMLIYVAHIFTSIVGIPTSGVVLLFMILFAVIPTLKSNVQNVYEVVQSRKGSMLNAVAMSTVLLILKKAYWLLCYLVFPAYSFLRSFGSSYSLGRHSSTFPLKFSDNFFRDLMSPSDLMGNYPHMYVMGTGLAFGFLVGRMILSHLCDEPKGLKTSMCVSLFYLPLAIANTLTARLNDGIPWIDEKWVLLGFCVYTAALYMHFATSVIHEITSALGIYCFR